MTTPLLTDIREVRWGDRGEKVVFHAKASEAVCSKRRWLGFIALQQQLLILTSVVFLSQKSGRLLRQARVVPCLVGDTSMWPLKLEAQGSRLRVQLSVFGH